MPYSLFHLTLASSLCSLSLPSLSVAFIAFFKEAYYVVDISSWNLLLSNLHVLVQPGQTTAFWCAQAALWDHGLAQTKLGCMQECSSQDSCALGVEARGMAVEGYWYVCRLTWHRVRVPPAETTKPGKWGVLPDKEELCGNGINEWNPNSCVEWQCRTVWLWEVPWHPVGCWKTAGAEHSEQERKQFRKRSCFFCLAKQTESPSWWYTTKCIYLQTRNSTAPPSAMLCHEGHLDVHSSNKWE